MDICISYITHYDINHHVKYRFLIIQRMKGTLLSMERLFPIQCSPFAIRCRFSMSPDAFRRYMKATLKNDSDCRTAWRMGSVIQCASRHRRAVFYSFFTMCAAPFAIAFECPLTLSAKYLSLLITSNMTIKYMLILARLVYTLCTYIYY